MQINLPRLHLQLEQWSRIHGERFRISLGPRRFLVTANREDIAQVMKDRPNGFSRSTRLEMICREMGTAGLFSSNGEDWKRQRPLIMSAFNPAHVKAYFPSLVKVTARLQKRWGAHADAGELFELEPELMRYTVDITAGLAFGSDINTMENDGEIIQEHLSDVFRMLQKRLLAAVPYWHWIRFEEDRRLQQDLRAVAEAVSGFIEAARRRMDADPERRRHPCNLLEAMIAARDENDATLSDSDLSGNVLTMLLAGEDTTAHTLAWLMVLLHRHPAWLAKMREEADALLGSVAFPTRHEQLAGMQVFDACIQEAMRLKPVAPVIVFQANRDAAIGGFAIPAGTQVMLLTRPCCMDERNFALPDDFRPERWLEQRPAASQRKASMPFGAGPRMCPGRYLALEEMKMLTSMLVRNFDIREVTTPDGSEVQERLAFTLAPVNVLARLERRYPKQRSSNTSA